MVENTFGILASRFRVFRKPILLAPQTTVKLIKASCALHNWIRKRNSVSSISVDIEDNESGCIIPGSWRNNLEPEGIVPLHATQERNFISEAREKKGKISGLFYSGRSSKLAAQDDTLNYLQIILIFKLFILFIPIICIYFICVYINM